MKKFIKYRIQAFKSILFYICVLVVALFLNTLINIFIDKPLLSSSLSIIGGSIGLALGWKVFDNKSCKTKKSRLFMEIKENYMEM